MVSATALAAGLLTVTATATVLTATPAAAGTTSATGTAGLFVPLEGRLADTRNGVGGYNTAMPANAWRTFTVDGALGMPATGISAVQITVTAITPAAQGLVNVTASDYAGDGPTMLVYNSGNTISGTTIAAVGADGKIRIKTQTSVNILVDLQGYYSAGDGTAAAGGYVPVAPTRVVDTRSGLGGTAAPLAVSSTFTFQIGGHAGVPIGASGVFAVLTPISSSATAGYITAFPSGTPPNVSLNYPGNQATAIGTAVDLADDGSFKIRTGAGGGSIDFLVDVLGYYSATPGTTGAFTPAATRVYDSRIAPRVAIPGSSIVSLPLAGVAGVPLAGSGISAVAVNIQIIHSGTANGGWASLWGSDQPQPNVSMVNFGASVIRSNLVVIRPGADGQVKFRNASTDPIHVVLDVVGWYSNAQTPVSINQNRTQKFINLQAGTGGSGSWVTYRYRQGITGGFNNVPVANITIPGTTTHPTGWPVTTNAAGTYDPYTWDLGSTVGNTDQLVQVQACYGTSATDTAPVCSMPTNVQLAAHAFGDSYDTQQVDPGTLATLTGDFAVTANDVTESSYLGSMSIGRSFTTLAPAAEQANASGVFGPGWTSDFTGPVSGDASSTVTDNSAQGYLTFTGTDGSTSLYQATTTVGTYPTSFSPVGDSSADGATVTKTSATVITMADSDGTQTIWTKNASNVWVTSSVSQAGSANDTTYTTDGAGRPTRILGAVPTGITCTNPDTTPGCRSLTFAYTTVTVAGVAKTRLSTVNLVAYNPTNSAMATTPVASYSYDNNGRLAQEWDPRITPNLKTGYTYDGNGRLATITPPGLATWTLTYDSTGRLSTTSRPDPSGTAAVSTTVIYSVPFTGTGAPVDVGAVASATWGQTDDPAAIGTAVFGPNHTPAGITAATITNTDWPYAALDFLDANGRNVNTASYGSGAWQTDATGYDNNGNMIWQLLPGNRAQALSPTTDTDPTAAAAPSSAARAALLASTTTYNPLNPAEITDSVSPTHPITLRSGTVVDARTHSTTTYNEGAPDDGITYMLPTTQARGAQTLDGTDHDTVTTHLGYAAITTGDTTGWSLHQATSSTVQMTPSPSGADLTTITRYNAAGQAVERRLPAGAAGGNPSSTITTYYAATGTGQCVSASQAGLVCSTSPAAQPTTGNPLPTDTLNYDSYENVTVATETAGNTTRTTTNTYDGAGRPTGVSIAVTPETAGGSPTPPITYAYASTTGLPTTSSAAGQTLTTGYDTLGRTVTYTDATGNTTSTGYDTSGRITSINDSKGTTTYSYDNTSEHRGPPTVEDTGTGGASTITATYDAEGHLSSEVYPNGLTAEHRYDNAGNPKSLTYAKGTTWMSFSATRDAQDRIATQRSDNSSQRYTYDSDGRLTVVAETVVTGSTTAACTTRTYTFDANSNRTTTSTYPDAGGSSAGNCSTNTTPITTSSTYDQADRLITAGYTYDTLGRTTTIPAASAQSTGSKTAITGNLTVGYYSNDLAAIQSQGGQNRAFTLDPAQNRISTIDDGTTLTSNIYSDDSDSPSWSQQTPSAIPARTASNTTWTRNITDLDGAFVGTQTSAGSVTLLLTDLHGDVVASVDDSTSATSAVQGTEYNEYGIPRTSSAAPDTYGWLGTDQRSAESLGGLLLMGVRLYNPASGRFLSADSITGGNANAYVYPTDPISMQDTSGKLGGCSAWINNRASCNGGPTGLEACTRVNAQSAMHCTPIPKQLNKGIWSIWHIAVCISAIGLTAIPLTAAARALIKLGGTVRLITLLMAATSAAEKKAALKNAGMDIVGINTIIKSC